MGAPVCHGLFGQNVAIINLFAVVVDYAGAGEGGFSARGESWSHADHFAVESDVFPDFDVGAEAGVDGTFDFESLLDLRVHLLTLAFGVRCWCLSRALVCCFLR